MKSPFTEKDSVVELQILASAERDTRRCRSLLLSIALLSGLWVSALPAQEPTIEFGGVFYSAENFVFCIDTSSSVFSGGFDEVQAELIESLGQLPPQANFAMVEFNDATTTFDSGVFRPATQTTVAQGIAWVDQLTVGGSSCMAVGLVTAINIAETAVGSTAILLFSDGNPNCPGPAAVLSTATAANVSQNPLHTIAIPGTGNVVPWLTFLQDLASSNSGTFAHMLFAPPVSYFLRGDANGDGQLDIADAVRMLLVGFGISTEPICLAAADANEDGIFQAIPDTIRVLDHLFGQGQNPLPIPFPNCEVLFPGQECAIADCP